jgi:hypothetical protein
MIAEFDDTDSLLAASKAAYAAGYRRMDAYTPFPVHGLSEALGLNKTRVPLVVLSGGIIGAIGGLLMMTYSAVIDYPINVGGRPLFSFPSFIPITFECTVLAAALAAVFGMLALNGLPMPYHPVFNVPRFDLASRSHFFLCIEARDQRFDMTETRQFLESLKAHDVAEVPF